MAFVANHQTRKMPMAAHRTRTANSSFFIHSSSRYAKITRSVGPPSGPRESRAGRGCSTQAGLCKCDASKTRRITVLREATTTVTGQTPEVAGVSYWMDAALFAAAGIPTVNYGPSEAGRMRPLNGLIWIRLSVVRRCWLRPLADFAVRRLARPATENGCPRRGR